MLAKSYSSFQTPSEALSKSSLAARLLPSFTKLNKYHWATAAATACLAALLRLVRLGTPHSLVFDETYYVKEGYSLLLSGYERAWREGADELFNNGDFSYLEDGPAYVVHPPVGKWLTAFGIWVFGPESSYGWRIAAALAGSLAVLCVALAAIKLFSSCLLGGLAGLYLAVDGHHLVQSRTGLLDIFLSSFVVGAFLFLLLDRENFRKQLIAKLSAPPAVPLDTLLCNGPIVWWRPWRLAATVCLALAIGTKWSALAVAAVFCVATVLWDMNARRMAGIRCWFSSSVLRDGPLAFCQMIPAMLVVYLATWSGWFLSANAWDRKWAAENPDKKIPWLPDALASLWHYHQSSYTFHNGLDSPHPYASPAWQWFPMLKPTSYFYESTPRGENGCTADACSTAINNIANPLLWWAASIAVIIVILLWFSRYGFPAWLSRHRDWRAGAVLTGILGGYVPWLFYPKRTMYFFYAVSFEPFMILALCYCFALLLGRQRVRAPKGTDYEASESAILLTSRKILARRKNTLLCIATFTIVALLLSAFFYPIWTAETIPYWYWKLHMWLPTWI